MLFLQGAASTQFAMVPMNLLGDQDAADYLNTGSWSKKAIAEAGRFCRVNVAASGEAQGFNAIPDPAAWQLDPDAAYVHYTPNETIGGVEFGWIPQTAGIPLVGDFSSTILSRPVEVERFAVIYAGAQKNMGPAGLCVVIVREDLIGKPRADTPAMLQYRSHADAGSMYNTPPTWSWYVAGLVFEWVKEQGGLDGMASRNQRKARRLYRAIDDSGFYHNPVREDCRSWMNVPFTLADPDLDGLFLVEAQAAGLHALEGHRSVGGMRASIYNAMPEQGVETLVEFMADFERGHG